MWHLFVLAQGGSAFAEYGTPIGVVAISLAMIRWLTSKVDKRDEVIEKLADRSNGVVENNTAALTRFSEQMGELMRRQHHDR